MTKNRDNLSADLDRLHAYAQLLARKYPERQAFWREFSGLAENVLRDAAHGDHEWEMQRIRLILADAGMEGPPV